MTTAEAAAPPDIPVEAALRMLRNAVFERASNTMSQADALHKRIGLLAARVDLLAATATATGDAPNSRAEIGVAARRVEEFRSIDPDVLLELVTALLVADDDPRAIAAAVAALRTGQPSRLEPDTAAAALGYLLCTGHAHQARRLLDALLPTAQSIPSWRTATAGLGVAISEPSPFARELLTVTLAATEEELARSPDDLALRRVHAYALVELGRREKGLQEFEEILKRDPSDGETGWAEVITLVQLGRQEQALALLEQLPAPISFVPAVLALRARLLLALDQKDAAVAAAMDAARMHPEQIDVRLALVEALTATGQQDEAQKQLDGLLLEHPDDPLVLTVRGRSQHAGGDVTGAAETLRRAVQLGPDDPDARVALAGVLLDQGAGEAALAHLDAALGSHPERTDILLERARVLRSFGRLVEALEALDAVPEGAYEATWELRGDLLLELDRKPEAISWYTRCLTSALATGGDAQRFVDALRVTAARLYAQDRYQEALDALAPIRRAGLVSPATMSLRAELLRLTEKWHESLAQADEVLAMGTGDAWIKGTKGAILAALSRSQEALDVLAPVLEESPGYLFGQSYRIVALDQLVRVAEAQQVLEEHFSEAAEGLWMVWTVMARSQLLIDAAQYEDAARILKEALRGGRDEASWYGPLAVAHARLGRPRRAVDTMRKAFAGTNGNLAEWARVELADALSLLPQGADGEARDEAREIYQWLASKQDHETAPKDVALRAWSQFRLGKPDDAIPRYRAAIDAAADPMLNERFQLGIALVMAGGPESGRSTLDRVLADLADIADRAAAKGLAMEALHVLELLKKDTQFTAKAVDFAEVREQLSALACLTPT
jgi:tetratricopeptide (TPR) repeat protein